MTAAAPARGVVCLTVDNLGSAADVGRGLRAGPDPLEPGLAVGLPRLLDLLRDLDVTATFFVEGWNALHHPRAVAAIARAGHDVGVHGWVHEGFCELTPMAAERVICDAIAAFRIIGLSPTGFRAPGAGRGPDRIPLLDRFGFRYDSSLEDDGIAPDMTPRLLMPTLAHLPWQWRMVDNYHYATARANRAGGPIAPAAMAEWRAPI